MDIQTFRMDFDAEHGPQRRNVPRVIVEVDAVPVNGTMVGSHKIRGVGRVEMWADALDPVAAKIQRDGHRVAYESARQVADSRREDWISARSRELRDMSAEQRERHIDLHCNERPELYLNLFDKLVPGWDGRRGMPPLRSAYVISRDGSQRMSVDDFLAASAEAREPYLIAPPATTESVQDQTSRYLRTIAEGLSRHGRVGGADERAQRKAG